MGMRSDDGGSPDGSGGIGSTSSIERKSWNRWLVKYSSVEVS